MIIVCPHCGFELLRELQDGVASCPHCNRFFNSSPFNKLLAAAWMLRRNHQVNLDKFKYETNLNDNEFWLVTTSIDEGDNHTEFFKILKQHDISEEVC